MEPEPEPEPEPEQPHAGVEREIGESLLADGVPISFVLAEDEITSTTASGALDTPRPFMVHLSRQSYLPLVFDRLRDHFADSIPPHTDEMWCSYEGTPLKWCAAAPLPPRPALTDAHAAAQAPADRRALRHVQHPGRSAVEPQSALHKVPRGSGAPALIISAPGPSSTSL